MGSRAAEKLKEIEDLRNSLSDKLGEIERRFPLAGFGRKAAAVLAGSSVGGTALGFAFRRLRRGGRRAKGGAAQAPSVTVNVLPKGASWIAAIGLAAWGGAKLYEALTRAREAEAGDARRAVVKPMPEAGRRTGSGS